MLLIFDIVFLMDRILDLLVGYQKADQTDETILWLVILKNLNWNIFAECLYVFGPFFFNLTTLNSIFYFLFKLPRYTRFFEMESVIGEYLDHVN